MVNYDYLYNKDYFGDKLYKNRLVDKPLYFRIIRNGTILPHSRVQGTNGFGGILDENNKLVPGSFLHRNTGGAYTPNEDVQYVDRPVIYFGMLVHIWGHCLTDNIKRVWFFNNKAYNRYFNHCPVVYTPMWDGIIPNFVKLLEILEIDVNKMTPITKPTKFREIIIPDESFFLEDIDDIDKSAGATAYFTKEYVDTVEQIRHYAMKNYTPFPYKKFYYYYGQLQMGEERLQDYFSSKGYAIVKAQNLSLDEQLNILANAENFASTVGSVSHNMIFTRDHTEVILIPRWIDTDLNQYQQALDCVTEKNIVYIDSTLSIFGVKDAGIYFFIISKQLREYFGDNINDDYDVEDIEKFCEYIYYTHNHGYNININAQNYYGKFMIEFLSQVKRHPDLMAKHHLQLNLE